MRQARLFPMFALAVAVKLAGCVSETDSGTNDPIEPTQQGIVGGTMVPACGWPTCVNAGGCTNTLIHPKIVTTAKHCLGGTPRQITFGETRAANARTVRIERCVKNPTMDVGFCILAEAVTDVPIVPVLSTCEAKEMIRAGQPAVLVGYGNIRSGVSGGGRKNFVDLKINALVGGGKEVDLGTAQLGACNGDSGGPAYLKMPDGTWRSFGVTSRKGPGGGNCASSTIYGLLSAHVAWIEMESGLDITPCHGPGGWEDGPNCDRFPTDPGGTAGGTWATMCSSGPVAKPMPTCMGGPLPPVPDGGSMPPPPQNDARATDTRDAGRVDAVTGGADTTGAAQPDASAPDTQRPAPTPDSSAVPGDTAPPQSPPPPSPPPPSPPPPPLPPPPPPPPPPTGAPPTPPPSPPPGPAGCACLIGGHGHGSDRPFGTALLALGVIALLGARPRRRR